MRQSAAADLVAVADTAGDADMSSGVLMDVSEDQVPMQV